MIIKQTYKLIVSFPEFTLTEDGVNSGLNPTGVTTVSLTTVSCPGNYLFIDDLSGSCQNPGKDLGNSFYYIYFTFQQECVFHGFANFIITSINAPASKGNFQD